MKLITLLTAVLIGGSCINADHWQYRYLVGAPHTTTQGDIAKEMGPPHTSEILDGLEEVWRYQYDEESSRTGSLSKVKSGSNKVSIEKDGRLSPRPTYVCHEYTITFRSDKTLKGWAWEHC